MGFPQIEQGQNITTSVTTALGDKILVLPKIPISTSPNSYPFDSHAQVESTSNRIRATDLLKVQGLLKDGSNLTSGRLDREKLHEKSQQTVKRWANTILGKRKQRLLNIKLRNDAAEQARIDIDTQWRKVQEQEHADAIKKCIIAQQYQTPAIRNLHSDLLLQDVVAERNLQVAIKKKEKLQQRAFDVHYVLAMRDKIVSDAIKENQKLTTAREGAFKNAQVQLEQIKYNEAQKLKSKEQEQEFYRIWQQQLDNELKKREADNAKHGRFQNSSQKEWCDAAIMERKEINEKEKIRNAKEEEANKRFNSIKTHIANTKKKHEVENLKKRQDVIERIGQEQWKVQCQEKLKRLAEEEKMLHSHDKDFEIRQRAEKENLRKRLEEISKYNRERSDMLQIMRNAELERERQEEIKANLQAELLRVEKLKRKQIEKEQKDALLSFLSLQMAENKKRNAQEQANSAIYREKCIERWEKEDSAFKSYALSLAKDLRDSGKSDAVVQRALSNAAENKNKEVGRVFGGVIPDHVNTFNRLGFC